MTPEELLLKHGIRLRSYEPGRYYTKCPKCSHKRSNEHRNSPALGVTIENGSAFWGCNHCNWTGPEKGSGNGSGNGADGQPLVAYEYCDPSGAIRFRKVRNSPGRLPRFWLQQPDGRGGWISQTKGIDTGLLYHADEIAKAIAEGRVICVAEGEKDVDNLRRAGFVATCNAHGASEPDKKPKWTRAHAAQLAGADIVVFNDNDPPGYAHADATCRLSAGVAKRIRRLDLKLSWPNIPEGGDVSDWLADGHSREELQALIDAAPDYAPIDAPQEPTSESKIDDEAELTQLARLSLIEYERRRAEAAKRLSLRASMLDRLVKAKRAELGLDVPDVKGRAIEFREIDPAEKPCDGAAVLTELAKTLSGYIIAEKEEIDALALWVTHGHALDCFDVSPRLVARAPTKRAGKTRVLECIERLAPRPLMMSGVSAAVLFRVIEEHTPTLLIDEFDAQSGSDQEMAEALRGVINSGFNRAGARILRNVQVGDEWTPRAFSTWAPVAIAGIGKVPDTIADRSVVISLRRKLVSQKVNRLRRRDGAELALLARQLVRFVADHAIELSAAEPTMPEGLNDRAADAWEPLVAIADAAGGEWPKRARAAAKKLASAADEEASDTDVRLMLLLDIKEIFERLIPADDVMHKEPAENDEARNNGHYGPRLSTGAILEALHKIVDRPWSAWGKQHKPMTGKALGDLLSPYGVKSGTIRTETGTSKGYYGRAFEDAFARYLPSSPASNRHTVTTAAKLEENGLFQSVTEPACDVLKKAREPNNSGVCDGVTFRKAFRADCDPLCSFCGRPGGGEVAWGDQTIRLHEECQELFRKSQNSHESAAPANDLPAGIPFVITRAMKEKLRACGFTADDIANMTPATAHQLLNPAERPPENGHQRPAVRTAVGRDTISAPNADRQDERVL
jgi:hypothetical protein